MKKRLAVILMITALYWMVISPIANALGYDPDRLVNRSSNSMEGDDGGWNDVDSIGDWHPWGWQGFRLWVAFNGRLRILLIPKSTRPVIKYIGKSNDQDTSPDRRTASN